MNRLIMIGVGGIGSQAMMPLCQYLNFKYENKFEMTICDGDIYEESNMSRQIFNDFDNKAIVATNLLRSMFSNIKLKAFDHYIHKNNIADVILEDDIVFICVDNNNTRHLIQEHCLKLKNCVVISGGNDYIDGNVMTFCRKNGKTLGKTFVELHKEIGDGKDKSPTEIACGDLAVTSAPQLVLTNYNIASIMMNELYNLLENGIFHNEVFTDITDNVARAVDALKCKIKVKDNDSNHK